MGSSEWLGECEWVGEWLDLDDDRRGLFQS